MINRANFLKVTLLAPLLALFGWNPKPKSFRVTNAKLFINGVEVPMTVEPGFLFTPRHDGDRSVMVGEWTSEMNFDVSLVEPIDEFTFTEVVQG